MTGAKKKTGLRRWLQPRVLIKVACMVLLPPLLMAAASTVVDPAVVQKAMIYGAPLAVMPLIIGWVRKRSARQAGGDR